MDKVNAELRKMATELDQIMERQDHALFQLLAQLEIAVSAYAKWADQVSYDQVTIAYRHYRECEDTLRRYLSQPRS